MRAWRPGLKAGVALKRTFGLPLSFFGAALAHLGLGVTLLGLSGLGFGAETIATLHKGVPAIVGPYRSPSIRSANGSGRTTRNRSRR